VTLFAAAFPLAAVCAMVNNIIEIRSDAYKVLSVQRPVAHRCANIGSWLTAFEVLGYALRVVLRTVNGKGFLNRGVGADTSQWSRTAASSRLPQTTWHLMCHLGPLCHASSS